MPYKRSFTLQEVHDLLYESEGRPSPKTGASGHTMALHGDMRHDVSDQRVGQILHLAETIEQSRAMDPIHGFTTVANYAPGLDGRFTSRLDLIKALHQALHSNQGQNKLLELDGNPGTMRVIFTAPLTTPIKNVERHTKATGVTDRSLTAHSVFVILDRLGTTSECRIHLQTAYPTNLH